MKRKISRSLLLLLLLSIMLLASGCEDLGAQLLAEPPVVETNANSDGSVPLAATEKDSEEDIDPAEGRAELVLIAASKDLSDPYSVPLWRGVAAYASTYERTCAWYGVSEDTTEERLACMKQAVENGAKVIVTAGEGAAIAVYEAQYLYPEVGFILLDARPHSADYSTYKCEANTCAIMFAEEFQGFLAGYAAVMEGYTHLGFLAGMEVEANLAYASGFVQGVNLAAYNNQIPVQLHYHFTGDYAPSDTTQTLAGAWYVSGTEVIFAPDRTVLDGVMTAAEYAGARVIAADFDYSGISSQVVASSMKHLDQAVNYVLQRLYTNRFPGGQTLRLGVSQKAIGIDMDAARFTTFTDEQYESLYTLLKEEEVKPLRNADPALNMTTLVSQYVTILLEG